MKFWREGRQGGPGRNAWAFMERFEVPSIDHPLEAHFVRYRLVQTPWFGLYAHRFDNADVRTFHDHPWNFVSVILRGGYVEAQAVWDDTSFWPVDTKPRRLRAGSINRKRATELHYVARLLRKPTWTLVLVGRRQRKWGYVDEDGWTPFDEHPNAVKFAEALRLRKERAS